MLASFQAFTWTGFFLQVGLLLAPSLVAAVFGARGAAPGTRSNIIFIAGAVGAFVVVATFCGWPRKLDLGLLVLFVPVLAGVVASYALARFLAR